MKFNEKLIELRKKQGLSQEELGYKLNVTRQTVSKWELGQTTPEMDKLIEIGKTFNVSVDELVNETETTSIQDTVIEDQTIGNEGTKENKVKIIIIGALIVVIVLIGANIFNKGFSIFKGASSSENITEEAEGIFDKFFNLFDKAIDAQQNVLDQATENNNEMNIRIFNSTLELYKGSNSGIQLKKLLDEVNTKNKTEQRKITVKYDETETQDTEVIKNLKTGLDDSSNFEVSFEYDEEGYIYEICIERVISQFEVSKFNNSFELYAGSSKGALVIPVLDNIITSNKTEERKITVKYNETETQSEEEIKNIKYTIEKFDDYEVTFEYDADGFINKAIIEKI